MKRNMKKWMFNLINSSERHAMPIMTYPGLKMIGKNIMNAISDGVSQYECMEALSKRYPSIAAMSVMDLSVEAEIFGAPVRYSEQDVPTVCARIVDNMETVKALKAPEVGSGRTSAFLKAVELASRHIKDRPVFGGIIGPFSLAGRLYDISEAMMAILLEPETMHALLGKSTEFLGEYAAAFKEAGANGIIIAEPAAGLLSPENCTEFSSDYVRMIVDAVQDDSFMVILHNCGNTENLVPSMLSTGAMGLHFGNAVDMRDIMPQIPWGRIALGNIDPAKVFRNGTVDEMKSKTWELLENTANYKNFVLSSGCDIPPGTSNENIEAFFDTLDSFNRTMIENAV